MPKNLHVCLDIGNQTFKIGVFEKKGRKLTLTRFSIERIDFIIGDSLKESKTKIANKVAGMLSAMHIHPASASFYLSLPGHLTFTRLLKLPMVDKAKIQQIVHYEAQQQVPFSLDEVVWDYQILGNPDAEHLHVLLVAMRQELISDLLDAFEVHQIYFKLALPSPVATQHAFPKQLLTADFTPAILNMGARSTNLIIFSPQTVWIRTIPLGGDSFTMEIQKELKLGFPESEELKISHAKLTATLKNEEGVQHPDRIPAIIESPTKRLLAELTRSVGFFSSQMSGKHIGKIFLTGGASKIGGMDQYLSQKLSLAVEYLQPMKFEATEIQSSIEGPIENHQLSEVLGLGSRILGIEKTEVNLLPKAYIAQQLVARKREYILLSSLCVLLMLGAQILSNQATTNVEQSRLNDALSIQKEYKACSDQISNYNNQSQLLASQVREISFLVRERNLWLQIITLLQKAIPQNVWIESLTSTSAPTKEVLPARSKGSPTGILVVSISGKTTGIYKDVSDFRDALDEINIFRNAQIRSANPPIQGIRSFTIQFEVEQ